MIKILLKDIKTSIDTPASELKEIAARLAGISVLDIEYFKIIRRSLDARKRQTPHFSSTVVIGGNLNKKCIKKFPVFEEEPIEEILPGSEKIKGRAVIVGSGPCGLFAAYTLAVRGYRPLVLERGSCMEKRVIAFKELTERGILDAESNVCFGEGGAGTFSDGKLTTRVKSSKIAKVLEIFTQHGADREITYSSKPHVGTDVIRKVVVSMRKMIIELGGEFIFNAKFSDISLDNCGELRSIYYEKNSDRYEVETNCLILAIGHSARDTYSMLLSRGLMLEPKPFAIGVRVEHKREMIDKNQYGDFAGHPVLGAADYKLRATCMDRGVFSFCMCPGGEVVCSATEKGATAVNGMSYSERDGENSNSAIVCSVRPEDYPHGILGGIELQRIIERNAFIKAEGYGAPAMNIDDFIKGESSKRLNIDTSYNPYVKIGNYSSCLPNFISNPLRMAMSQYDNSIKGFTKGIMLGVETRTSSPVRILRDDDGQSIKGIYPAGEGAGYAGGIVSAAVDGIKAAEHIIRRFSGEV